MATIHHYDVRVTWTGRDAGFARRHEHTVAADGPPPLLGSADPAFGGDPTRWNPEQVLTAALSQCHMLWYLALCRTAGIDVVSYVDEAHGAMEAVGSDGGRFVEVVLRPVVVVAAAAQVDAAVGAHDEAHTKCYIANSVNFPVRHEAVVTAAESPGH